MRRAVPLVVVAEDYFQYNASIAVQFALDAVYSRYDMSDPSTHKPGLVKPFTSVTLVVSEDFLEYRRIVLDAAEASQGYLRVELLGKGKTPELIAQTYQLKVPGANFPSEEAALLRFAVIVNCSQRLHDKLPAQVDAVNIVDMIRFCSISNTVSRDVLYFTSVQKLEAFCQQGNLWLDRNYRSSADAATVIAQSLRNIAQENLSAITKSRETNAHWNSTITTQWLLVGAVTALSAGLTLWKKMNA